MREPEEFLRANLKVFLGIWRKESGGISPAEKVKVEDEVCKMRPERGIGSSDWFWSSSHSKSVSLPFGLGRISEREIWEKSEGMIWDFEMESRVIFEIFGSEMGSEICQSEGEFVEWKMKFGESRDP